MPCIGADCGGGLCVLESGDSKGAIRTFVNSKRKTVARRRRRLPCLSPLVATPTIELVRRGVDRRAHVHERSPAGGAVGAAGGDEQIEPAGAAVAVAREEERA